MGDNKSIKPNTTPYKIIEVFSQGKHKALTGSDEHIVQEFKDFLYNAPLLKTDKIDPIKVATGKMLSKDDKENIKNLISTNLNMDLKEINLYPRYFDCEDFKSVIVLSKDFKYLELTMSKIFSEICICMHPMKDLYIDMQTTEEILSCPSAILCAKEENEERNFIVIYDDKFKNKFITIFLNDIEFSLAQVYFDVDEEFDEDEDENDDLDESEDWSDCNC